MESIRNPEQKALLEQVEMCRNLIPVVPGYAYRGAPDFVLQHGEFYEPRRLPADVRPGAPGHCFGNAINLAAWRGFKYVEGYALMPPGLMELHGWNADVFGALVDSTWLNAGLAYLGVEFSVERADDATWNGDACVLNDYNRGFPIFRERWEGERDTAWPPSERIELVRAGKMDEAVRWMREHLA